MTGRQQHLRQHDDRQLHDDPRLRADSALLRARREGVVTPDDAGSPMDDYTTLQIPSQLVTGAARQQEAIDPDVTVRLPASPGQQGPYQHGPA